MPEEATHKTLPHRLHVHAEGPQVGEGRISAADLADIIKHTQIAVNRIGEDLLTAGKSKHEGASREAAELCELNVIATTTGTFGLVMEVADKPSQEALLVPDLGKRAIKILAEDMKRLPTADGVFPPGTDKTLVRQFAKLGKKIFARGIERIVFTTENGQRDLEEVFIFNEETCERFTKALEEEQEEEEDILLFGRLEKVDVHTIPPHGVLYDQDEKSWNCLFAAEDAARLKEALMRYVEVDGLKLGKPKDRIVEVRSFEQIDASIVISKSAKLLQEFKEAREDLSKATFLTREELEDS